MLNCYAFTTLQSIPIDIVFIQNVKKCLEQQTAKKRNWIQTCC